MKVRIKNECTYNLIVNEFLEFDLNKCRENEKIRSVSHTENTSTVLSIALYQCYVCHCFLTVTITLKSCSHSLAVLITNH